VSDFPDEGIELAFGLTFLAKLNHLQHFYLDRLFLPTPFTNKMTVTEEFEALCCHQDKQCAIDL
jgi:hypothetical protein